jgi:hypothetical protein
VKRTTTLWIIAFVITFATAYYQRTTGPTYPLAGTTQLSGKDIRYRLLRSNGGFTNAPVEIQVVDSTIQGVMEWKRFKTDDPWTRIQMKFANNRLMAELPNQPPAGKLQYRITLLQGESTALIPAVGPVVIRFKGDVPLFILIVHVIAMFGSMLLAVRAGLEYFNPNSNLQKLTYWTIGFFFVGGMVLGPIVQKYAFDAYWTGWPFGGDMTDNKTAVALLAWLAVAVALKKSKNPKAWALGAAVVMIVVYLIPHSVLGSELDYKAIDQQKAKSDTIQVR